MKNTIFNSAVATTIMLLVVKALGFLKQSMIAAYFGATLETDLFFLASNFVMSIVFALFSNLGIMLVTNYISAKSVHRKRASELISKVLIVVTPIALLLSVCIGVFANQIAAMIGAAYDLQTRQVLSSALRIVCIVTPFYTISAVFDAVLIAEKKFVCSKCTGAFYSISVILCTLLLSKVLGIKALYLGFVLYLPAICIFTFTVLRKQIVIRPINPFSDATIKNLFLATLPICIGSAVQQLNNMIDNVIATFLNTGAVSALVYGQTLSQFVNAVIITNAATVMFPYFADYITQKNDRALADNLKKGLGLITFCLLPIGIITILCSEDIIKIVFMRGAFDAAALNMSSQVLIGYGIGFLFSGVRELVNRVLYAYGDTKAPMYSSLVAIAVNIVLSIMLSKTIGIMGISTATSISSMISMLLSLFAVKKYVKSLSFRNLILKQAKQVMGGVVSILAILAIRTVVPMATPLVSFALSTFIGGSSYLIVLLLLKTEETYYLKIKIKSLFWK